MKNASYEVYQRSNDTGGSTHLNKQFDQFNPHPGGDPIPIYKERESVRITKQIISTIFSVAVFLVLCRLTHFRTKILYDKRIDRNFLRLFYLSIFIYLMLYFYLLIKLKYLRPKDRRVPIELWDKYSPKTFYTCVVFLVLSILSFIFALFKTFKLMTFVLGFSGLMAALSVLQWTPI